MESASPRARTRGEGTGWRMALLVPLIVLAAIGAVCAMTSLGELSKKLADHGGPAVDCKGAKIVGALIAHRDMLCLELAFTPKNAAAVFSAWSVPPAGGSALGLPAKIEVARQSIHVDWWFILSYVVFLSAAGLLLMWLLRHDRRTMSPVLFCCPIIAGMLDVAENLCILQLLASPERPDAVVAALGGTASAIKWLLLLVVIPIAVIWALVRLPWRARAPQQVVESFTEVLKAERAYVAERRQRAGSSAAEAQKIRPVGLSLSGGGIRSATFNLGVLQALSRLGVLSQVDYLSTVSGGGYIGSCLSSLLSHPANKNEPELKTHTFDANDQPYFTTSGDSFAFNPDLTAPPALRGFTGRDQLRHLRTHGDFLIARRSLLSRDTLRAVGNALGSTVYHILVTLLFTLAFAGLYLAAVGTMIGNLVEHVAHVLSPGPYVRALFDAGPGLGHWPFGSAVLLGVAAGLLGLLLEGLIHRCVPSSWLNSEGQSLEESREYLALWTIFWVTIVTAAATTWYWVHGNTPRLAFLVLPLGVYVGGQLTSFVLYPVVSMPSSIGRDTRSRFAGAHGLFTYLNVISLLLVAVPYLIVGLLLWRPGGKTVVAWLLSFLVARLLASGSTQKPAGGAAGILARLRGLSVPIRNALLSAIVAVLIAGSVILFCVWILELAGGIADPARLDPVSFPLAVGLTALALFVLLGVAVDFNKVSLHYFYRDRLVETYLQTFAPARDGTRSEVRKRDDSEMPLTELHGQWSDAVGPPRGVCPTSAPYHLVMAALNLTASRDMTRRNRKSDYFLFSKLYCGSESTGYMRSDRYRSGETKLARAMTISGAAASSAIGAQTFLAQSFALTFLGVRLGQWMENPRYRDGRRANRNEGGVFWPFYLLREMIGSTDATRRLVNVSDGGHTGDNVGICLLLKRRCAVIIACDAEADSLSAFGSLTEALRQIYIDENIRVEMDLDRLRPDPVTKRSARHWAVGRIRYPPIPAQGGAAATPAETGYLVVLKSSFVGGTEDSEPLKNYKQENPEFPHQSTVDQFFDDDQFESYRELGDHIGSRALDRLPDEAWHPEGGAAWTELWDARLRAAYELPDQAAGPDRRGGAVPV
jgi:Patatin-like phospholipase